MAKKISSIRKAKKGKFRVRWRGKVTAKGTTAKKARAQRRAIGMATHGVRLTGKRSRRKGL